MEPGGRVKQFLAPPYRFVRTSLFRVVFERDGFETSERVWIDRIHARNPEHGWYTPAGWFVLRRALRRNDIAPDDVFVDIGSGKGRIVYQAARYYPFGRVIGVEIAEELVEIARRNLALRKSRLRCRNVEFVTADAGEWQVPDDVTVVFLNSPVLGDTFRMMLANILASIDRNPRRLRLIYYAPFMQDEIVRTGRFHQVKRFQSIRPHPGREVVVYEHGPGRRSSEP